MNRNLVFEPRNGAEDKVIDTFQKGSESFPDRCFPGLKRGDIIWLVDPDPLVFAYNDKFRVYVDPPAAVIDQDSVVLTEGDVLPAGTHVRVRGLVDRGDGSRRVRFDGDPLPCWTPSEAVFRTVKDSVLPEAA